MSLNPRTPGANHTHSTSRLSTVPTSASKTRQLSHLHAQLAQLTANMSDMENLLRMTAVQAEGMRGLGGYAGGMFMAASKVLGEETVNGATGAAADASQSKLKTESSKSLHYPSTNPQHTSHDNFTSARTLQHMASPHTCTPDNDMETSLNDGEYLTVISQLMAEKDRLITEKDELVVSKDRLWREMYQMLNEKNGCTQDLSEKRLATNRDQLENQRLRMEVSNLKRRNKELELALRDALEADEDYEDGSLGNDGIGISAEGRFGALQRHETLDEDAGETPRDTNLDDRSMYEHQHLHTPMSQQASLNNAELIAVDSRPPVSVQVQPLIEINGANEQLYGRIAELTTPMLTSVMNVIGTFGSFDRFAIVSRKGYHGCVERNLNSHSTFWTTEYPGHYTCKTCFNKKQPCMRAIGNNQWVLLPLPPVTRNPDTDWQDTAYYIRSYEETSQRFPGTWRVEPHSKRDALKREREVAVAHQSLPQAS